jgi:putative sporulation protein YtxC
LAKYILGYQSWQWLIRKVKKECPELAKEEWLQIVYAASQWLKGISNGEYDLISNSFNYKLCKNIYKYISENTMFDVEGYSRFRLSDYYAKLQESLNISIEEFYWQREYEEFVWVLKSFLANQKEIIKVLHILMQADGQFVLLDENKQLVRDESGDSVTIDGIANLYDDVLIGSILALAPAKIILHHRHCLKRHFRELLEDVVGERISYCNGCDICRV